MKFETLKSGKNRFWKRLSLGISLFVLVLVGGVSFYISYAKYQQTQSIKIATGTINYKIADLNIIAMYKDGAETTTMPGKGYVVDQKQSYCYTTNSSSHDATVKLSNDSDGNLVIGGLKKGSKCVLYFVKDPIQDIIASSKGTVTDFSKTACDANTNSSTHTGSANCESTDKGVYQTTDADGTSYYYRGTVNNNWVKFANMWWRIIRINGNGSIRLIYSGTVGSGTQPTDTSASGSDNGRWVPKTNSQTTTSAYNSDYKDNTYVGYYYGATGASSYSAAHTNATASTIATYLNGWYTSSGLSSYASKLDGATGWCNDRTPYQYSGISASSQPDTSSYGYGTKATYYGAYFRRQYSHQPTHTCSTNDLFTLTNSGKGNGKLTVPVGLITADEVMYAGGRGANNYGYWLYTGNSYWTMSPYYFNGSDANVFYVDSDGWLDDNYYSGVRGTDGVRPVINLKAGTTFKSGGNGTVTNPYEVS